MLINYSFYENNFVNSSSYSVVVEAMGASESTTSASSTNGGLDSRNGTPGIEIGDIIYRPLPGVAGWINFCHYGVYIGKEEVIHFTTPEKKGSLERVSLAKFKDRKKVSIQTDFSPHNRRSKKETAMKAIKLYQFEEDSIDWITYDVMSINCEHFANFCATGVKYSRQSNSKK